MHEDMAAQIKSFIHLLTGRRDHSRRALWLRWLIQNSKENKVFKQNIILRLASRWLSLNKNVLPSSSITLMNMDTAVKI